MTEEDEPSHNEAHSSLIIEDDEALTAFLRDSEPATSVSSDGYGPSAVPARLTLSVCFLTLAACISGLLFGYESEPGLFASLLSIELT